MPDFLSVVLRNNSYHQVRKTRVLLAFLGLQNSKEQALQMGILQ